MTDLIKNLLDVSGKIAAIARNHGDGITWENAFSHPDVVGLRDDLLALLGAADEAGEMIASVAALEAEWDRLSAIDPPDVVKVGAVAAAARALSYPTMDVAGKPLQVFVYTMRQVLPYLEQLVKVGVAVAAVVA